MTLVRPAISSEASRRSKIPPDLARPQTNVAEPLVEVKFDGVQRSPRYPGGVTLRFARVLRYREDKPAAEADTLDMVRALSHADHRDNPSAAAAAADQASGPPGR